MPGPYPEAIAHYPKSAQIVIRKFYNRVYKRNKNVLVVFVGPTGSGKSYSVLSLMVGFYLYRDGFIKNPYDIIEHCSFKALDLMKKINIKENISIPNFWLWDEAGVDAGTQEHATTKNKILGWYGQTSRHQNQILAFTLPGLGMLTPQIRKLLHYYCEAIGIDVKEKKNIVKLLEMQYNTRLDKIYYHKIKGKTPEGKMAVIKFVQFPLVDEKILELYEREKAKFTSDLNIQIQQTLQALEEKSRKDLRYEMKESHKDIYRLYHKYSKKAVDIAAKQKKAVTSICSMMKTMDKYYEGWRNNPNLIPI